MKGLCKEKDDMLFHEPHENQEMFDPLINNSKHDPCDYMYMYHDKKDNYYYKHIDTRQYVTVKKGHRK